MPRSDKRPGKRRREEKTEEKAPAFNRNKKNFERYKEDSGEERSSGSSEKGAQKQGARAPFKKKPFRKDKEERGEERSSGSSEKGERRQGARPPFKKRSFGRDKEDRGEERSSGPSEKGERRQGARPPFKKRSFGRDKEERGDAGKLPYKKKEFGKEGRFKKEGEREGGFEEKSKERDWSTDDKRLPFKRRSYKPYEKRSTGQKRNPANEGLIRLNKYIANTGVCSRREADDLIRSGAVSVNGKIITEMGFQVKPADVVNYGGETLRKEKLVYILLNKPKDYISTVDDPQKRRTVLDLIQGACRERVYPVGRLDRNTTGVLLLTNDGDLTKRLTHPSHGAKKIYHVVLDRNLKASDMEKISGGFELEDGPVKVDEISYVGDTGKEIGITIHSGRNRIVRRIFESLDYKIDKLDRVYFAGLTKKDLQRGHWRVLSEKEVGFLKMSLK